MADRTIKPDSGNDLVLQNNGGATKIEIPNSGDIEITGTIGSGTFNGTIGSATFPSGHIITHSTFYSQNATSYFETSSTTYTDQGLEISITPKFSNTDSFIVVSFYSGLAQDEFSNGAATINYSTSSGVTTESSSTKVTNSTYPIYIGAPNALSVSMIHQNYSSDTTQYYRIFLRSFSSGSNVRLIHNNSTFSFYAYEVKR